MSRGLALTCAGSPRERSPAAMSNTRPPTREKIRASTSIAGSFNTQIRRHKPTRRPLGQICSSKARTMARPTSVPLMTVGGKCGEDGFHGGESPRSRTEHGWPMPIELIRSCLPLGHLPSCTYRHPGDFLNACGSIGALPARVNFKAEWAWWPAGYGCWLAR
jgi:hypothetical protein